MFIRLNLLIAIQKIPKKYHLHGIESKLYTSLHSKFLIEKE